MTCGRTGCGASVAIEQAGNVEDITLLNKARDCKWDQVNGVWVCKDCRESLAQNLKLFDLVIRDGKVVPRNQ